MGFFITMPIPDYRAAAGERKAEEEGGRMKDQGSRIKDKREAAGWQTWFVLVFLPPSALRLSLLLTA
jgi:hypothetical protein